MKGGMGGTAGRIEKPGSRPNLINNDLTELKPQGQSSVLCLSGWSDDRLVGVVATIVLDDYLFMECR